MVKTLLVEIIAYAPTAFYHCTHCEVAWRASGMTNAFHDEQVRSSLPGDLAVIMAKAPLAEVTRYAAQLGSITQGQGSYTMEFSHYDQVPGNVQQQIVSKAKLAADEED